MERRSVAYLNISAKGASATSCWPTVNLVHAHYAAAALVHVAHDIAGILLGHQYLDVIYRLEQYGISIDAAS